MLLIFGCLICSKVYFCNAFYDSSKLPVQWQQVNEVETSNLKTTLMVHSKHTDVYGRLTPSEFMVAQNIVKKGKKTAFKSLNDLNNALSDEMTEILQSENSDKRITTNKLDSMPCLVLNADYQPLSVIPLSLWSWQDAVKAVFLDRVVVVRTYDCVIRSANMAFEVPSVIVLKEYVKPQHHGHVEFCRKNLYLRDDFQCQYCGNHFLASDLSYDHVVPRTLGGKTTWDNIVTCCRTCNHRKGQTPVNKLKSVGMKLMKLPRAPSFYEIQEKAKQYPPKRMHSTWEDFLEYGTE